MAGEQQSSRFIFVQWEDVQKATINERGLSDFLIAKTKETPLMRWGNRDHCVLLIFEKEKKSEFLKSKLTDDTFWKIKLMKAIQDECCVKVSNIPAKHRKMETIYNFFVNKNACGICLKSDLRVYRVHVDLQWCVLCLKDPKESRILIENQTKLYTMDKEKLELQEFYECLYHSDTETSTQCVQPQTVSIEVNDNNRLEFLKQCYGTQLKVDVGCDSIDWPEGRDKQIKLHFERINIAKDKKKFANNVKSKASDIQKCIVIIEKKVKPDLWDTVFEKVTVPKSILVRRNKPTWTIIGMKDSEDIKRVLAEIDNVKAPIVRTTKTMPALEEIKMSGFRKFQMNKEANEKFDVQVEIQNDKIVLKGIQDKVDEAETWILERVNDLNIRTFTFPRPEYGRILSTAMMLDTISASCQFSTTEGQYDITDSQVVIYIQGKHDPDAFYKQIVDLITEEEISKTGKIASKEHFKTHLKRAEEKYEPYVIVSHELKKDEVIVRIVCGVNYLELMQIEIERVFHETIIEKEFITLPRHVFDFLNDNSMKKIQDNIKSKRLNENECFHIDSVKKRIAVEGYKDVRQTLRNIIMTIAGEVITSWRSLEKEGITQYFSEKDNVTYLKDMQKNYSCKVELATKYEMKNNNISCMVLLSSGQVGLAASGRLPDPTMGVDAIINPTSITLRHFSNVSSKLIKKAGNQIMIELIDVVETSGPIQLGEVYVTGPGGIPCQRLIHTALFDDENSRLYDETIVQIAMGNVFETLKSDKLRSVAMSIPANDFIKTFIDTVTDNLRKYPEVKEVYFYDINPDIIRQLKSAMDKKFGGRCYHLPVENIDLGKGQMTLGKSKYTLERTGKRTLPLPGGKRISIEWGVLSETKADIIVCPTSTAPRPTGIIFNDLKEKSGIDLGSKCEAEFKKIDQIKDGTLVETIAGKLGGCNKIYHIKISDTWTDDKGLKQYILNCLKEALRKDVKSIAFPTIGTADYNYPGKKVATTLIKTIGEFIKLHTSSALEEVKIIVFKRDRTLTVEFEEVIQTIYSQRPHRLKAVIEETITGIEEKDEDKKEKPTDNRRPQSANRIPQQLTRANTFFAQQNPKARPAGLVKYTVANNVTLTVVGGDLTKAVGDVIVCTTSAFPLLNGQISKALTNAGGPTVQTSLKNKYPKGYPKHEVASGNPGKLKCQKMYYIQLQNYKSQQDMQIVYGSVQKCLNQADKEKHKSIIFPALGTGGFGFPDKDTADKMCKAIQDFFATGQKSLINVVIVIYHTMTQTVKTFQNAASKLFQSQNQSSGQGSQAPQVSQLPSNIDRSGSIWNVPGTETCVELKYGNIENWKADVIVDTTTSFPNITGAIPDALCRIAGQQLKAECRAYKGPVNSGDLAVTDGCGLACKKVFHYVMPSWNQQNGDNIIKTCVNKCLDSLLQNRLSSIAMPTIGTGGFHYDARVVATALYRAAETFGNSNKDCQIWITVVMFPQSEQVNKVFKDKLQDLINQRQAMPRPVSAAPKKRVNFPSLAEKNDDFIPAKQKGDFILLRFTSNDTEKIKDAFADIEKRVKNDSIELQPIKLDGKDKELLSDESKKELKRYEDVYCVRIEINMEKLEIAIHGMGDARFECRQKVMEALQKMKEQKNRAFIGQHVYKYLEWCYAEDRGNILVPYQSHITFLLEENHKGHANEIEFKDSDENTYIVSFNKMEEHRKGPDGKKEPDTMVRIERRDLMAEDLKPPSIWLAMDGNLKTVTLQSNDAEYKNVKSEFCNTLGRAPQIKEIKRIQNMHLFQLYETKKKQIQSKIPAGVPVERLLWHGVNENNELSIISNGFNRSYSGQTHGGKVYYGHGSYFAVKSEYASQDYYAPVGNSGFRRVFQAGVLTGNTTMVIKNYDKRCAPLLQGSQTDRYDSVCDDMVNPAEFVIFNDTQAYPKYVIYFT